MNNIVIIAEKVDILTEICIYRLKWKQLKLPDKMISFQFILFWLSFRYRGREREREQEVWGVRIRPEHRIFIRYVTLDWRIILCIYAGKEHIRSNREKQSKAHCQQYHENKIINMFRRQMCILTMNKN